MDQRGRSGRWGGGSLEIYWEGELMGLADGLVGVGHEGDWKVGKGGDP